MSAIIRPQGPTSTSLLLQILERPGLVAAVRELPGAVLGKLIDRIGLEDAGELVALATTEQLERVFDDDLWRAERAGGDETFQPERFALWLHVMLEVGDQHVVQRLCELPPDLVALAVHRLVLVLDTDVVEELLLPGDEEAEQLAHALDDSAVEEWEEFRLIAREPDAWEDVWNALMLLDREHHDRLRAILEACCGMTTEYISGQGGLFQVLTAAEMLESDVAAVRDDRRASEGFISPADARAFLTTARRNEDAGARDAITNAYFRGLQVTKTPATKTPKAAAVTDVRDLAALLREAEVLTPEAVPTRAALEAPNQMPAATLEKTHLAAPLFEQAMRDLQQRDPVAFSARVREVGYLVNVWMAGGAHQVEGASEGERRQPRPAEALELVLRTCEAGLRAQLGPSRPTAKDAVAVLAETAADLLFRRGFRGTK